MTFPEDNDGICKICKDMVTQARDQLQSNETQVNLSNPNLYYIIVYSLSKKKTTSIYIDK